MKIEEIDFRKFKKILEMAGMDYFGNVERYEKKILEVLDNRLLPDTLYFWFDAFMDLWDAFVRSKGLRPDKKRKIIFKPNFTGRDSDL